METLRERDRVQCKFYAHGACLKGEHCEYAHDWKAPPNKIYTFYQRGACAYGNRYRYDHVKMDSSASSSSRSKPQFGQLPLLTPPTTTITRLPACDQPKNDVSPEPTTTSTNPADHPICSFAATGHYPRGVSCPHLHADMCPTCGKLCLYPFWPLQREEHSRSCEKLHQHLNSLKRSQEIESSVCLKCVLSNPNIRTASLGCSLKVTIPFVFLAFVVGVALALRTFSYLSEHDSFVLSSM